MLDANDPNYASEDDGELNGGAGGGSGNMAGGQSGAVQAYKKAVEGLIDEYFQSGDMQEASTMLQVCRLWLSPAEPR